MRKRICQLAEFGAIWHIQWNGTRRSSLASQPAAPSYHPLLHSVPRHYFQIQLRFHFPPNPIWTRLPRMHFLQLLAQNWPKAMTFWAKRANCLNHHFPRICPFLPLRRWQLCGEKSILRQDHKRLKWPVIFCCLSAALNRKMVAHTRVIRIANPRLCWPKTRVVQFANGGKLSRLIVAASL